MERILAECPRDPQRLIPLLRRVQEYYGYIPREALAPIARHLRISRARVWGVATFYTHFSLTPRGRHTVCLCRGTACHVRGSKQILDAIEKQLGVRPGQTTADRQFTLQTVACGGGLCVGARDARGRAILWKIDSS